MLILQSQAFRSKDRHGNTGGIFVFLNHCSCLWVNSQKYSCFFLLSLPLAVWFVCVSTAAERKRKSTAISCLKLLSVVFCTFSKCRFPTKCTRCFFCRTSFYANIFVWSSQNELQLCNHLYYYFSLLNFYSIFNSSWSGEVTGTVAESMIFWQIQQKCAEVGGVHQGGTVQCTHVKDY